MYEIFEKLLLERGLRAADVARATGLSSTFFSEWKKGKSKTPNIPNLKLVADFFGISLDYLMGWNEEDFSDEQSMLDSRISKDMELKEAIAKYYTLSDEKRKHVIELINLL